MTVVASNDVATLKDGTVILNTENDVVNTYSGTAITLSLIGTTIEDGVNGVTVKVTSGETENIEVAGMDVGDKFTVKQGDVTTEYEMTKLGLRNNTANELYEDYQANGTAFPLSGIASLFIAPVSSDLGLTAVTGTDTATYAVVDATDTMNIKFASMAYTPASETAVASYTFSDAGVAVSDVEAAIGTISVGSEGAKVATSFFAADVVAASAAENAQYTINDKDYVAAGGNLTFDATSDASTLKLGGVKLATGSQTSVTTLGDSETDSADDKVITVTADGVIVTISRTAEGSEASETVVISSLNAASGDAVADAFKVSFSGTETSYAMAGLGLIEGSDLLHEGVSDTFTLGTTDDIKGIIKPASAAVTLPEQAIEDISKYVIVDDAVGTKYADLTYTAAESGTATYEFAKTLAARM